MKYPYVTYDEDADVLYVGLTEGEVAETRSLGDLRLVDIAAGGTVIGVEFISASHGVDLDSVPFSPTVETAIRDSGLSIKIYA